MLSAKKLLLVSAISAISSSAFAMQAMNDQAMADTTGQDGLTVSIATPAAGISMETRIHDSDGFAGATNQAAIVLGGASGTTGALTRISTGTNGPIVATIDAGDSGTSGPVLNVAVSIPAGTTINTGTVAVGDSTGFGNLSNETTPILNDMAITLGATNLNIQLGNAPQGAMILANTVMSGGLTLSNFALNDPTAGGSSISASSILMQDNGTPGQLTVKAKVDVTAAGLVVTASQVGSATTGFDQQITALKLGGAPAIGNVEVIGLNVNNTTITVAGH